MRPAWKRVWGDKGGVAIYRLRDADEHLLYVGVSNNPPVRFEEHAASKSWWPEVRFYDLEWLETRQLALSAESDAIWLEQPKYNKSRPFTADEGVWYALSKRFPRLLALERQCTEAGFAHVRCLWPDVLHDLLEMLHGQVWGDELEVARTRLEAFLPEHCSCPDCWDPESWGD